MSRFSNALIVVGLLALTGGVLWQLGLVPGSRVTLPRPVALSRAVPDAREVSAPPTPLPVPTLPKPRQEEPTPLPMPVPITLNAADADDRAQAIPHETGYAVRLAIPAIKLDTEVKQAGIVEDSSGKRTWETRPFVAVHYGDLTSRIGAPGNAVIAGHVVTVSEGNVFRFLYQLDLDDQVEVWDDHDRQHDFHVVDVKLVLPSDTSVMAPTADETLTLITCGGTFDPVKREFSDRLIVTAKPV